MERIPVKSSQIRSIGYHEQDQVLEVEFASGALYRYAKVPYLGYRTFLAAESKGHHFQVFIRPCFEYSRVHLDGTAGMVNCQVQECWCHKPKKEKPNGETVTDANTGKTVPTFESKSIKKRKAAQKRIS